MRAYGVPLSSGTVLRLVHAQLWIFAHGTVDSGRSTTKILVDMLPKRVRWLRIVWCKHSRAKLLCQAQVTFVERGGSKKYWGRAELQGHTFNLFHMEGSSPRAFIFCPTPINRIAGDAFSFTITDFVCHQDALFVVLIDDYFSPMTTGAAGVP